MYEEEDEDLPAQYRRLTAHLQTNSVDFNRRLHAYLASQHATRAALAQYDTNTMMNPYMQQYPNAPHFAPQQMMPQAMYPQMVPPQMIQRSPTTYRQQPYPMNAPQGFRPQPHQRSMSIATPGAPGMQTPVSRTGSTTPPKSEEQRRMSLPAQPLQSPPVPASSGDSRPNVSGTAPSAYVKTGSPTEMRSPFPMSHDNNQTMAAGYPFFPQMNMGFDPTSQHINFSPFSMSLPENSQQFLAQSMDPNDPTSSMLMGGSDMMTPQPSYSYNPNPGSKSRRSSGGNGGMHQTLAPSVPSIDTHTDTLSYSNPPSATTDGVTTPFSAGYAFNGMDSGFGDVFKGPASSNGSAHGSGTATPIEWGTFMDNSYLEEPVAGS